MTVLDNVDKIRDLDPSNMYNKIFDLPEQMIEALKIVKRWQISADDFSEVGNMVLVGMGGSAIAGEIVRTLYRRELVVPFEICRNYTLPEYVDDESLVLASSYSGNTEETIAAVEDALARKAMLVAFSTGGMLGEICRLNSIPMAQLPVGLPPRAALGYSFTLLLSFLERVGYIEDFTTDLKATVEGLSRYRETYIEDNPTESNPAKLLAKKIHGRIPIFYSGPVLTDAACLRFRGQLAENSKTLSFGNQFPEFNHNELVGYCPVLAPHRESLLVVLLRDADDHPQVRSRMNIVKEIIAGVGIEVMEIHSKGSSQMERLFSLVQVADFASYYLAVLNEVDPEPVEAIERLKQELLARKTGKS